jgi:hypothetical protein
MNARLCGSFLELSSQTWDRLGAAWQTGLAWSEETNTESLLLALRQRHPNEVKIVAFSKRREAYIGADWEFWIGATGAWVGMRVQAKRISLPSLTFAGLQKYHTKKAPQTQIDTLITQSARDKLNPVYCLYTYLPPLPCPPDYFFHCSSGLYSSQYGCLIGHAQALRNIASEDYFALRPALFPWHFLVCDCSLADPEASTAEGVLANLRASIARTLAESGRDETSIIAEGPEAIFEPRAELPEYMTRLRELPYAFESDEIERLKEMARAEERGIGGLTLINTARWR